MTGLLYLEVYVQFQVAVSRPSHVLLDRERGHAYVLNLWGREPVIKYAVA